MRTIPLPNLVAEATTLHVSPGEWLRIFNRAAGRDPQRLRRASQALALILAETRRGGPPS